MPAFTYLSNAQVDRYSIVLGDEECNDILQQLRRATGENWLVRVDVIDRPRRWFRKAPPIRCYTLYADCHGEWQVINLVVADGGSIFVASEHSRDAVMNYMLGYIAGVRAAHKRGDTPHER